MSVCTFKFRLIMGFINEKPESPNTQGWEQFLTGRKAMLDNYDRSKIQERNKGIHVEHGKVAEAEFRKWLKSFLPKKFGVTSGYIISQGLGENEKTPHFDVIIFDQMESPILWSEDNPDSSDQGRSLAIPAEFVRGVIEVKSRYKASTVKDAISQIGKLKLLLSGHNPDQDGQKVYLPSNFFWTIVFFEYYREDRGTDGGLNNFLDAIQLRGFLNKSIVLRHEDNKPNYSMSISLVKTHNNIASAPEPDNLSNPLVIDGSVFHYFMCLTDVAFSEFALSILTTLNPSLGYIRYANGSPGSRWCSD